MEPILIQLLTFIGIPALLGIGGFVMRSYVSRIDALEQVSKTKLDEPQIRQIIADKIDPIREDVQELKVKLDTIIELLIKRS